MSVAPLPETKNLFKCLNGLRYFGVGSRVTRNIYKFPDTYFIVTKVKLTPDQNHGRAWGVMVWRGIRKEREERMPAPLKNQWNIVDLPDYKKLGGNAEEFEEKLQALVKTYGTERVEWTEEEKLIALGKI